ncbi:MAG: carbonic anhydrase [Candidatus Micrarchaeia archaeon]
MTVLTISCMDMRLNGTIEDSNVAGGLVLRNAGANISGMKGSIRGILDSENITEIKLMPHNDCGAMKVVYGALKKGMGVSSEVKDALVSQFSAEHFETLDELEKINYAKQERAIKEMAPGVKVSVEPIDLSKYHNESNSMHVLAFTYASKGNYNEICKKAGLEHDNTYFVHLNSIDEAAHDIEIGIKNIGIKKVFFIAQNPSEYRRMLSDMQRFSMKDFMNGVEAKFVKL